jgi:hypothetical protein
MRALVLVLALSTLASPASAQEAATDADLAGLAVFTAVVASSATWVTTTPWTGFWRDHPEPMDWRAWVPAILVGAAAGVTTYFTGPRTHEGAIAQALALVGTASAEVIVLMFRAISSFGADRCDQICHKLVVALPLVIGVGLSVLVGQLVDAETGPSPTMSMPLTMEF